MALDAWLMNDSMFLLGAGLVLVLRSGIKRLLVQSIRRRRKGHEAFNEAVLVGSFMCNCGPACRTFVEQRYNKPITFKHGHHGA